MYDPELLRCFVAVAETRSFSAAGRQLGVGQPTVSGRIRRLEQQVDRVLVARDTRSVALTDDGEAMLGFARRALAVLDEAHAFFAGPRSARASVSAPPTTSPSRTCPGSCVTSGAATRAWTWR
ncbi:LysR family transcriptional regulator [Microbacterium nymphoidis]|uniref:LysR family transcriptional regulator n=1 Tax=Microbacterium nymphoidis TaxID=2898586 RepID=UPI0027DF83D5|nr:LysR family transcriptional regulator [Microbacterium nymphoidis]